MFALTELLLLVFCVCFNCALAIGVLCLLQLCSYYRCFVVALTVLLLLVFCVCFNCSLDIGVLWLL